MQQQILFSQYTTPAKLKVGKDKCPCCGKLMRAYKKTIDTRLIKLLYEILVSRQGKTHGAWNPREVFKNDHHKINDFQKLHYFGLISRSEHTNGYWKITDRGRYFLLKQIQIPKELWVFNNEVIEESDELTDISKVDERWQQIRADWTFDYMPYNYNIEI